MEHFQNGLIAVASATVVLGIMIFVHEWGHFIAAKLLGVRVEVFSFGFGPRLFGVKRGDTDYRLSALPFGGYVRMSGDNPVEARTNAPYEFLSKPRWVRVLIAVAGPAMNFLLALVIFWGIFWRVGLPYDIFLRQPAVVAALPLDTAGASGIQPGDLINSVNGVKTPTWESVYSRIRSVHPGDSIALVVSRGNSEQTLTAKMPVPAADIDHVIGYPPVAPVIDEIAIGLPAEAAGMKSGDTITSINGRPVAAWQQLVDVVRKSNGSSIRFVVQRDGKEIPITVTAVQGMSPDGSTVWQIGVGPKLHTEFQPQGFFTAAQEAGIQTALGIKQIGDVLAGLFSGKVHIRELQGVVGIARISGQAAKRGTMDLIWLMATISLNLGLLNLLPIPILDGGHVLLLAIEGVIRRDLSIAVKERFVQVGLVFLLGIFAFVMYSDISKLIQSH